MKRRYKLNRIQIINPTQCSSINLSKKRGPNSPNKSAKMKKKPNLAAVATMSIATMLSAVTGAVSSHGQDATSVVNDSEDKS